MNESKKTPPAQLRVFKKHLTTITTFELWACFLFEGLYFGLLLGGK